MNFSKKIIVALTLVASVAPATFAQEQNQKSKAQKAAAVGKVVFSTAAVVAALILVRHSYMLGYLQGRELELSRPLGTHPNLLKVHLSQAKGNIRGIEKMVMKEGLLVPLALLAAYLCHKKASRVENGQEKSEEIVENTEA